MLVAQVAVFGPTRQPGPVILAVESERQPAVAGVGVRLLHLAPLAGVERAAVLEPGEARGRTRATGGAGELGELASHEGALRAGKAHVERTHCGDAREV